MQSKYSFPDELQRLGPEARSRPFYTPAAARDYCRWLARCHYENFTVASWLLPAELRPHFYALYAYCRWADDLADETSDPTAALRLLDWWEGELRRCYQGEADHPVFVALGETIRRFDIPIEPFADLLVAFRRDQTQTRYETFDELLDYCRCSANPVGRMILYLDGSAAETNFSLSDAICTGLQLANFWQDVARDFRRGRIYLPGETLRRFGCDPAGFPQARADRPFRDALALEVERAEAFFRRGEPLVRSVSSRLRLDVELFLRGGRSALHAIRQIDYDVWSRRPTIGKAAKLRLFLSAWLGR